MAYQSKFRHFAFWLGFAVFLPLMGFLLATILRAVFTSTPLVIAAVSIFGVPDLVLVGVTAGASTFLDMLNSAPTMRQSEFYRLGHGILILALLWNTILYGGLVANVQSNPQNVPFYYFLIFSHPAGIILFCIVIQIFLVV